LCFSTSYICSDFLEMPLFNKKKQELASLRDEYQRLPEREKAQLDNLHSTAIARQKHKFLERFFIDDASIPGIGSSKKSALRSFGIETAADVTWSRVIAVKGFGEILTRSVLEWRNACESKFIFNPNIAVTDADKNSVRTRLASRKRTLETTLNMGVVELQRLRQAMINKANELNPLLLDASQKLAQAQADLKAI
ncbi:MAG: hypothetical protein ACP5R6_10390, partial [Chlorobaculum sp.]